MIEWAVLNSRGAIFQRGNLACAEKSMMKLYQRKGVINWLYPDCPEASSGNCRSFSCVYVIGRGRKWK